MSEMRHSAIQIPTQAPQTSGHRVMPGSPHHFLWNSDEEWAWFHRRAAVIIYLGLVIPLERGMPQTLLTEHVRERHEDLLAGKFPA